MVKEIQPTQQNEQLIQLMFYQEIQRSQKRRNPTAEEILREIK